MAEKAHWTEISPTQAIELYERAVKSEPGNAEDLLQLGAAHYISHHWDEAARALEKAVAINPKLGHAHYYLGVLYAAQGDRARAEKELDAVSRVSKNPMLIAQARARIPAVTSPAQLAST